jgi:CheY-like chemotaxis protein
MPTEQSAADGPVLLVDDDDVFVDLIQRHLEAPGYVVAAAGSV